MRTLAPLLLALGACSPTIAGKVTPDTGLTGADGADGSDGADDTGTDGTEDPEPEPDFTVWEGSRTFTVDSRYDDYDCEGDEVAESGVEVTSGAVFEAIQEQCPLCSHVYEIEVATDEACGWIPLATTVWRGLVLGEDSAQVYRFAEADGRIEADDLDLAASFDGWAITYDYTAAEEWWGSIEVDGQLAFPEAE